MTEDVPEDPIEYDLDTLIGMTTKQLACQVIHRLDLFFPHRPGQLDAAKLQADIIAKTRAFSEKLSELAPSLAEQIESQIQAYELEAKVNGN